MTKIRIMEIKTKSLESSEQTERTQVSVDVGSLPLHTVVAV